MPSFYVGSNPVVLYFTKEHTPVNREIEIADCLSGIYDNVSECCDMYTPQLWIS